LNDSKQCTQKKIEQQRILKKEEQNNIEKTFILTTVRVERTKISKNFVIDDRVNSSNFFNYDVNKRKLKHQFRR
jgi:hypothetical protein